MAEFTKDDAGKIRLELIDPDFIMGVGEVLTYGANKYAANNWKLMNGQSDIDRVKGAMLRHMMAYMAGEELDPESGLQHLYHISCGAMFLNYFDQRRVHVTNSSFTVSGAVND